MTTALVEDLRKEGDLLDSTEEEDTEDQARLTEDIYIKTSPATAEKFGIQQAEPHIELAGATAISHQRPACTVPHTIQRMKLASAVIRGDNRIVVEPVVLTYTVPWIVSMTPLLQTVRTVEL